MKKTFYKGLQLLAAFALVISTMTVNSTCFFEYHQPEVPESLKKLKK